ncbi:MAG TPA: histidine triad nucleotide-binding protein [Gemmatimonadales bacterium]
MDCIFCRIGSGDIPATIVTRNEHAIAFRDLHPQAPTHVLVIPIEHVASTAHLSGTDIARVLGQVTALAAQVASDLGLGDAGYRMVVNTGPQGGQTVDHLHVHLLGGRQMHWPPG